MSKMSRQAFEEKVAEAINQYDPAILSYDKEKAEKCRDLYEFIREYAYEKQLYNTALSLPIMRGLLDGLYRSRSGFDKNDKIRFTFYEHALAVCKILIDLHVPLNTEEEDILLAGALCHDLMENIDFPDEGRELLDVYHLDRRIYEIVGLITRAPSMSESEMKAFCQRIQENKLAVLVSLADRGNVVELLYGLTIWDAREYVYETKAYFLPMCIYAKEHYTEVDMVVNILMEKIRCLIDVTDILSARYQKRELALTDEILNLREENARIRGLIAMMQEE